MRKVVFAGFLVGILLWLAGCSGVYKQIEIEYPISPYTKYKTLNINIISSDDINKKELNSFKELIILALQKRGISVVNAESPKLIVEILNFNKDNNKFSKRALTVIVGIPFTHYTSNAIEVKVSIKDKERTIEKFKEFQEFKENMHNWEDLKQAVANRIADAVYFAH
jgi:hypothetical protein